MRFRGRRHASNDALNPIREPLKTAFAGLTAAVIGTYIYGKPFSLESEASAVSGLFVVMGLALIFVGGLMMLVFSAVFAWMSGQVLPVMVVTLVGMLMLHGLTELGQTDENAYRQVIVTIFAGVLTAWGIMAFRASAATAE